MRILILLALIISISSPAQWQLYDIGTTLEVSGVHLKPNGDILISGGMGMMKKSADCGTSWTDIPTSYIDDLGKMQFLSEDLGFILADDAAFGKTLDGGETWTFYATPAPDDLEAMYFLDESNGYMVGKDGGIVHTTNGGTSWTLMNSNSTQRLQGVYFTDENHGIVSGRNQTLLKTEDGGTTWIQVTGGFSGDLSAVSFNTADNGFICGEGGLYHVTSDLSSIEFISLGAGVEFNDIYFLNSNIGWVCGGPSSVFATINGGLSWIAIEVDGLPFDLSSIHGNSLSSVFTVGEFGKVNGLCAPTSTLDPIQLEDIASVFLTDNTIRVEFIMNSKFKNVELNLFDIRGCLIQKQLSLTSSESVILIDKPDVTGVYLLQLVTDSRLFSTKLYVH
jgi:photosystem II stability/assembly factor-like uncharacterized protein